MTTTEFYGWQLLWWVLATAVAFTAALLFWRKGLASVGGKGKLLGDTPWKLSGAAAIFVVVLGLFHFVNPLKNLSDYTRVLVIYQAGPTGNGADGQQRAVWKIHADEIGAIKLDRNAVVVEMIPLQSVASLLPELDGKSFSTGHPIATGTYRLRVIQKDSGKAEEFVMEVPPNS